MKDAGQFVIAVKRERRHEVPRDWQATVRGTSGVTVLGEANPSRMQIEASADGIQTLKEQLSAYLNIEKVIPHRRL